MFKYYHSRVSSSQRARFFSRGLPQNDRLEVSLPVVILRRLCDEESFSRQEVFVFKYYHSRVFSSQRVRFFGRGLLQNDSIALQ